jgi:hypothetical protein
MLSKDFNFLADDLQLEAKVKFDSIYAPSCPIVNVLIKGNKDYAWVTLGNKGCESNLGIKVGNRYLNGKTNDLSRLGIKAFLWEKLHVKLFNGRFILSINDSIVKDIAYTNFLGELKEVDLFFNGIGNISEVQIGDKNGNKMMTSN